MIQLARSSLVLFLFGIQAIVVVRTHLLRHKREWVLPPVPLTENQDYTRKEFIAKIRSDRQIGTNVIYSLEGVGANQYPFHVFVVDPLNGNVRVTRKLDREEIPLYKLAGVAKFPNGTEAEAKIDLQIKVVDENDNAPTFESSVLTAEVDELSPKGTSVFTISATDKDDNTTDHAKIAYVIKHQEPRDYFTMTKDGTISVNNVLDREV